MTYAKPRYKIVFDKCNCFLIVVSSISIFQESQYDEVAQVLIESGADLPGRPRTGGATGIGSSRSSVGVRMSAETQMKRAAALARIKARQDRAAGIVSEELIQL
jgi:hypothetical protein